MKACLRWASDLFSCCVYSVVFMRCRRHTHNGVPWIIVKIKAANNGRGNLWRKREIDIVQVLQSSCRTDFNYTSRRPGGGPDSVTSSCLELIKNCHGSNQSGVWKPVHWKLPEELLDGFRGKLIAKDAEEFFGLRRIFYHACSVVAA